jgi:hypothetical protein
VLQMGWLVFRLQVWLHSIDKAEEGFLGLLIQPDLNCELEKDSRHRSDRLIMTSLLHTHHMITEDSS